MREKYNPTRVLQAVQKQKYKQGLVGIALVLLGLFLQDYIIYAKYVSLAGLLQFFFVSMLYRISKNRPPELSDEVILSPIDGIVKDIRQDKIVIKKSFYDHADFRLATNRDKFNFEFQGKLSLVDKVSDIQGRLIGFMPGSGTVTCTIPVGYEVEVITGTKLMAGESVLATKTENEA